MTLYGLEQELAELLQMREDVAEEVHVTEDGRAEQTAAVAAMDAQISEYVKRQAVVQADSVLAGLREFKGRFENQRAESKRLAKLADANEERFERLKHDAAEALAAKVEPAAIVAATQNTVLYRAKGRLGQLKLCKSPASVDVTDPSLVPDGYKMVTVTMPAAQWEQYEEYMLLAEGCATPELSIDKRAIGAVLKQQVPCNVCKGTGDDVEMFETPRTCGACGGSGSVPGSVPGARLIRDSVHLRLG
jgi:hypothetical protein